MVVVVVVVMVMGGRGDVLWWLKTLVVDFGGWMGVERRERGSAGRASENDERVRNGNHTHLLNLSRLMDSLLIS